MKGAGDLLGLGVLRGGVDGEEKNDTRRWTRLCFSGGGGPLGIDVEEEAIILSSEISG